MRTMKLAVWRLTDIYRGSGWYFHCALLAAPFLSWQIHPLQRSFQTPQCDEARRCHSDGVVRLAALGLLPHEPDGAERRLAGVVRVRWPHRQQDGPSRGKCPHWDLSV